ncbi:MAG TPA: beta-ketoacyl-ACP synthase III [Ardenticatenaceae bacterium]|nr:beta-ketoacyl-ACP synthase III [Ardenticatenaceae bacterium]
MRSAYIRGWGKYVPPQVMTNNDLARFVDTDDEWIRARTGIAERRVAGKTDTTLTMAIKAGREALRVADFDPTQVELIIVGTTTPDRVFPSTASMVQDDLGAERAAAFDLAAACSGFVYALSVATTMLQTGAANNALVIGADAMSHILDWSDRNTCVLFGDGAGAFFLEAHDQPGGILSFELGSDGSGGELLTGPMVGNTYEPAVGATLSHEFMAMNGRAVFRFATRIMGVAAERAVAKAGLAPEDIDLFIPHQANVRIIEAAAKHLKLPMEKVYVNIHRYGNTSAASIPVAWCEAIEEGRLRPGDRVVMVGFGGGLSWGAVVAQWQQMPQKRERKEVRVAGRWLRNQKARATRLSHKLSYRADEVVESGTRAIEKQRTTKRKSN